jgi:hypothetical protein
MNKLLVDRMAIEREAENYALSTYLTEFELNSYDEIMEALYDDIVLDDVVIWQPFENFNLDDLAKFIEITRNDFLAFAQKITEREGGNEF